MVRGSDDDSKSSGSKLEHESTHKTWPASQQGPGLWFILTQDVQAMLSGRDGTKMIGPLDSTTVIDKIEGGEIDTDSSMISFSPLGFDTPLWEPISLDKVIELYKIARNEARVTLLNSPGMATNAIPTKGSINGAELAELLPPQTNDSTNVPKMGPTNIPEMGPINVPTMGSTTGAATDGPGQKKTNKQKKKQKTIKKTKLMKKTKLKKKRVKMKQDKDKDKDKGADGVT